MKRYVGCLWQIRNKSNVCHKKTASLSVENDAVMKMINVIYN
jgi:hypothetical protein